MSGWWAVMREIQEALLVLCRLLPGPSRLSTSFEQRHRGAGLFECRSASAAPGESHWEQLPWRNGGRASSGSRVSQVAYKVVEHTLPPPFPSQLPATGPAALPTRFPTQTRHPLPLPSHRLLARMVPVHIVQFSLAILALLLAFASAETKTREVNPPFCKTVDSKGEGTGQTLKQSEDDFNSFVLRGDAKAAVSVIFFNNTDNGYINKDNFESSVYKVEARLKSGEKSTTYYQVIKDTLCEIKEAKDWERLTGATYYGPGE